MTPDARDRDAAEILAAVDPAGHAGHVELLGALQARLARGETLSTDERVLTLPQSTVWLIDRGLASEWPRPEPDRPPPAPIAQGSPLATIRTIAGASTPRPRPKLVTEDFAAIREEEERWLWPHRIPLGAVSLILGRPGEGKSTLTSWLAATVSAGLPWPDSPEDNEPGTVLVLQAEESKSRAVKPRLTAFGYAPGKILSVKGVDYGDGDGEAAWFSLAHNCEALSDECERLGDVRLIVVDPLLSFLGGLRGNNGPEVREALRPLFRLAEHHDLAVVAVTHPNKDAEGDILDRVTGAGAFVQLCRMAWYLSPDPRDKTRRLLSLIKGNSDSASATGIAYGYDKRTRRLTWLPDPVELSARDVDHLLAKQAREAKLGAKRPGRNPERCQKAEAFILDLVAKGPVMLTAAADAALTHGIKNSTFRRALKQLMDADGRVRKEMGATDGRWWLHYTPAADAPAEGPGEGGSDDRQAPPEEGGSGPPETPGN